MAEKLIEIHGFASQQGGSVGETKDFKCFEISVPELYFASSAVAAVSLDIIATILISGSSTSSNIGKQATRRIKAVAVRSSDKIVLVEKTIEGILIDDPEMLLAQTNIKVIKNKLYLVFAGTSSGYKFSCSANVRYFATGEEITKTSNRTTELIESYTIEDQPVSPVDIEHNDLSGRASDNAHPSTAIDYDNSTSGLVATDVQTAIEEIQDLANHGPQTGSITRVGGEVTEVEYVRKFGTTTIVLTRDGDGNVVTIESTYDNGVDTPIVRTKTLTYDVDGNLESWEIV